MKYLKYLYLKKIIFCHSHKKRKDSLELGAALLIFLLEPKISGVAVQSIHQKTAKIVDFSQRLLSENDFETVLATFCCYDHSAKASPVVQKIATDQKEHCKCSLCVI